MEVLSVLSIKSIKGGSGPSQDAMKVGTLTDSSTQFPTTRPDGSDLHDEDWVIFIGTPPKTIGNIEFTKIGERAYYDVSTTSWSLSTGVIVNSSEVLLSDRTNESISGTSISQEETNEEFVTELKKKLLVAITEPTTTRTILHNFGEYPNVLVIDSNNDKVEIDVSYPSRNSVKIDSIIPFTGYIRLSI